MFKIVTILLIQIMMISQVFALAPESFTEKGKPKGGFYSQAQEQKDDEVAEEVEENPSVLLEEFTEEITVQGPPVSMSILQKIKLWVMELFSLRDIKTGEKFGVGGKIKQVSRQTYKTMEKGVNVVAEIIRKAWGKITGQKTIKDVDVEEKLKEEEQKPEQKLEDKDEKKEASEEDMKAANKKRQEQKRKAEEERKQNLAEQIDVLKTSSAELSQQSQANLTITIMNNLSQAIDALEQQLKEWAEKEDEVEEDETDLVWQVPGLWQDDVDKVEENIRKARENIIIARQTLEQEKTEISQEITRLLTRATELEALSNTVELVQANEDVLQPLTAVKNVNYDDLLGRILNYQIKDRCFVIEPWDVDMKKIAQRVEGARGKIAIRQKLEELKKKGKALVDKEKLDGLKSGPSLNQFRQDTKLVEEQIRSLGPDVDGRKVLAIKQQIWRAKTEVFKIEAQERDKRIEEDERKEEEEKLRKQKEAVAKKPEGIWGSFVNYFWGTSKQYFPTDNKLTDVHIKDSKPITDLAVFTSTETQKIFLNNLKNDLDIVYNEMSKYLPEDVKKLSAKEDLKVVMDSKFKGGGSFADKLYVALNNIKSMEHVLGDPNASSDAKDGALAFARKIVVHEAYHYYFDKIKDRDIYVKDNLSVLGRKYSELDDITKEYAEEAIVLNKEKDFQINRMRLSDGRTPIQKGIDAYMDLAYKGNKMADAVLGEVNRNRRAIRDTWLSMLRDGIDFGSTNMLNTILQAKFSKGLHSVMDETFVAGLDVIRQRDDIEYDEKIDRISERLIDSISGKIADMLQNLEGLGVLNNKQNVYVELNRDNLTDENFVSIVTGLVGIVKYNERMKDYPEKQIVLPQIVDNTEGKLTNRIKKKLEDYGYKFINEEMVQIEDLEKLEKIRDFGEFISSYSNLKKDMDFDTDLAVPESKRQEFEHMVITLAEVVAAA